MNKTNYFHGSCNYCVTRIGTRKSRQLEYGICFKCKKYLSHLGILRPAPENQPPSKQLASSQTKSIKVRSSIAEPDEKRLIQLFHQLQSKGIGRNWRAAAAKRIGWKKEKIKETIKCVRRDTELIPVPIATQLINYLTREWQSAHQIFLNFPNLKFDWIYINLNLLAKSHEIERKKCQPNRNLYRLTNDK